MYTAVGTVEGNIVLNWCLLSFALTGIGLEEAEAFREALLVTVAEQEVVGTAAARYAAVHPRQRGWDLMVPTGMQLVLRSRDQFLGAGAPQDHGRGLDRGPLQIHPLQNQPTRRNQCRGLFQAVLVMWRKVWSHMVKAPLILPGRSSKGFRYLCTSF